MIKVLKVLGFIITTIVGVVLGDLYSKTTHLGKAVTIFFGVAVALLYLLIMILLRYKKKKVSYEKIDEFLEKRPLCTIQEADRTLLRNDINSTHKARCIYQIRLKHHINWIDAIYWGFMGELAELGVECIILIHDTEFYAQESVYTEQQRKYKYDLKMMCKWIRKISNNRVKIVIASKYYKSTRHNSNFINVLYNSFLPFLANNYKNLFCDSKEKGIHNIRYILGLCMLCNMKYKGVLLSVIWSGRKDVFEQYVKEHNHFIGNFVYTILCKTYYETNNNVPKKTTSENELYFDGTEKKIKSLLKEMNEEILEDIKRYAFHEKEKNNMGTDDLRDYICKKIIECQRKINGVQDNG